MQDRVIGAFKQVIGFIVQGMDFEVDVWRDFEVEMRQLIAPHMAVLAHRRTKLLDGSDGARWAGELDGFMHKNLLPLLGDERAFAERNFSFVRLMLDVAVAEEQRRKQAECASALPYVSGFDASWAS